MTSGDWDLLVHRYFQSTLSPEEEVQFWDILRSDPKAADRFVELAELESGLVESLRAEEELPSGVHAILRTPRRSVRRMRFSERRFPWAALAAAALFVLALSLVLLRRQEPSPTPDLFGKASTHPAEPPPAPSGPRGDRSAAPAAVPKPEAREPGRDEERAREEKKPAAPEPKPSAPGERPVPAATPPDGQRAVAEAPVREQPAQAPPEKPKTVNAGKALEATLERVEGEVVRVGSSPSSRPQSGQTVVAEQGLETRGAKSLATLRLSDGTRLELRGDTRVEKLQFGSDPQKSIFLMRGTLVAAVAKQPEGRFLIFRTPQAEVTVLGTKFLLQSSAESTRVDVEEGRVRLRRVSDGLAIEIPAGHSAQVAKGVPFLAKLLPIVRSFQDGSLPTPDYSGTRDTGISSASPSANTGTSDQLRLHRTAEFQCSALFRWDLSSIPPKSKVLSVEVSFWITGSMAGGAGKIHEVRRPWEELEATWKLAASGRPWQSQGAQGEADRGTKILATLAPLQPGMSSFLFNDAGVALVQQWILTPQSNCGIAVTKEFSDAWDIASREWPTVLHRPKLTVTYVPLAK